MKNIIKKSFIFLLMLMMLPMSSLLVSCGATPEEDAKAVAFVSNKYDAETGKAIFEVDLNKATELTYKCTPSSSKNEPRYTIPVEGQTNSSLNRSRFDFEKGIITIKNTDFEQIEIKVEVNGFSDQCIVRLKEYPVEIYPHQAEVVLNAGSSYTICPVGKFSNEKTSVLSEEDYNFTVTSDDETIISVARADRLTVYSARKNKASATVTVTLNNINGESTGKSFKVKFTVIEPAEDMFLVFKNNDKFIEDGDTLKLYEAKSVPNANGEFELKYVPYFISSIDTNIYNVGKIETNCDNNQVVSFDNVNKIIKVKSDKNVKVKVTLITDMIKEDGSALKLTFYIDFIAFH